MKQGKIAHIVYLNESKDEITQRTIIPTFVPLQTIKSIDISEMTPAEQEEMQSLYQEYADYYNSFIASVFNFETWVEHTKGRTISPKWRAFKIPNIKQEL